MTKSLTTDEIKLIVNSVPNEEVRNIKSYILFAGHAHSGHSIIGALLDAHPDIAIANEINIPKQLKDHQDISLDDLYKTTLFYSKKENKDWFNTEYKYKIHNSFQGLVKTPQVLGDKKGGGGTRVIMNNPEVLEKLLKLFGNKLKFIHVKRKPIDNIAAYAYYWGEPLSQKHLDRYLENLETTLMIKNIVDGSQWLTVNQDAFLRNPKVELANIYEYLQVQYTQEQLNSYTSIVKSNIESRASLYEIEPKFIDHVNREVDLVTKNSIFH